MERLELLDEEEHILGMRIVGGDHRLQAAFPSLKLSLHHSCPCQGHEKKKKGANAMEVSIWGGRLHFRKVGDLNVNLPCVTIAKWDLNVLAIALIISDDHALLL
ncbi:abscisic acid receptor PYL8-like protein [Tanacetum coccineum]